MLKKGERRGRREERAVSASPLSPLPFPLKFIIMQHKKQAKITLAGAGPGDPELLTIKALRAVQSADVILYDALVNREILRDAPVGCLKIYVGKRADNHRYTQDEINLMLVQYAFSHGHVVRLKGGDSFVFGRGHEEITYADAFGIETVVIPGISSCISVPELQRVPVTRRGVNESFWVLTATTKNGCLSKDLKIAAQSNATAVILMGTRKIRQIVDIFSRQGKADTPAMVIQNGSLPDERKVIGTVADIADRMEDAKIGAPGIIVIGEVVGLHPELLAEAESRVQNPQTI